MRLGAKWFSRWLRIVALLLIVWVIVAWLAARFLIVDKPLSHADVIVVLSGSSVYTERTRRAAEYYRQGLGQRILLTNDNLRAEWSSAEQRNPFFYELARTKLIDSGVPSDRVEILAAPVTNTYDEAQALRDYALERKLRSLLVVTSAYHSRRALWTLNRVFANSGIEIGMQSVENGEQSPRPLTWWLYPRGWQMVVGEYVKNAYYRLLR